MKNQLAQINADVIRRAETSTQDKPQAREPRKENAASHSPLPWKVMADPSYEPGLHPLHNHRFIATEAMGVEGNDFDGEGSLICALRDQSEQAADAAFIVEACNNYEQLLEACKLAKSQLRGATTESEGMERATNILQAAITKAEATKG